MEVGKAMYERDKTSRAVPCWLIFDDRYRKRYAHLRSSPGRFPRKLLESGMLKQAWTLDDLARMCGIDGGGLRETVERFNDYAARGLDPEYGRGESAYNRALGDPNHKVHPCLGPIEEPPYYAVEVVPGDIGTCGGLLTDELARVLDQRDEPIPGLYATGNTTATVMGRHYLGPGASIANSMVFGYVAARHAAASSSRSGQRFTIAPDGDGAGRTPARGRQDVLFSGGRGVEHHGDVVAVQLERTGRGVDAVAGADAHVAVDLDLDGHATIVRPRCNTKRG